MSAFRNLKIGARLGLAFGAILVILALSVGAGVWRLSALAARMHTMATTDNQKQQIAAEWQHTIVLNAVRTRAALLGPLENIPDLQREMDATSQETGRMRDRLVAMVVLPAGKAMIATIDDKRNAYRTARADLLKRKLAGEDVRAALESQLLPLGTAYTDSIRVFEERQKALYLDALKQAEDDAAHGEMLLIVGGAVALVLGALFAFALSRSVVGPLRQASASANRIAEGDLSEDILVVGRDEAADLQTALKGMQANLSRVVSGVRINAEGVATASAEIAQGNNDLSARTEQQASALEETAASMEELSSTVRQNADNAQQANQLAQGATNVAVKGGEVVARVVDTMKGINESSRKISDIISVIDGIAFQTNILALNAAVEAARAGEQGRGFAVVASEVRSLAQRSAEAAKQIKGLIGTSVERVEQGTALVDQAGTTMQEVVASIRRVTDLMGEISAASAEQSAGVAQVGEAVTQMDQATQQNAALVEQSAAAAASLKSQAEQMVSAVAVFRLGSGAGRIPTVTQVVAAPRVAPAPGPAPSAAPKPAARPPAISAPALRRPASPAPAPSAAAKPKPAATSAVKPAPAARAQPPAPAPTAGGSDDDWETF